MVHKCRDIQNKKEDVLVWIELFEEEGVSEENFKEIEETVKFAKSRIRPIRNGIALGRRGR